MIEKTLHNTMIITTPSAKETKKFAKKFSKKLHGGHVIGLEGNLGGGKTTFVQGLAESLGIKQSVNSPTFVLMNIYKLPKTKRGITRLVHFDAYRISKSHQEALEGLKEQCGRSDTLCVIEWIDRIHQDIRYDFLLKFFHATGDRRKIEITGPDSFDI